MLLFKPQILRFFPRFFHFSAAKNLQPYKRALLLALLEFRNALKSERNISVLRTGLCLLPKLEVLFFRKTLEFFRLTGGVLTQANTTTLCFRNNMAPFHICDN